MKNKWSLVIHDVGTDYANVWVGTLFPNERKFESSSVTLLDGDQIVQQVTILKADWERPFSNLSQRFCKMVTFKNLQSNTKYDVLFSRDEQTVGDSILPAKDLSFGSLKTLPEELTTSGKPFVVALGSCYYEDADAGRVAKAYTALLNSKDESVVPDVKFLTGDQVYLDIGLDSLSPKESEITNRIADDYADSWKSLRPILRNGGTWMLADDHEYWNNYPNTSGKNPYLWMITLCNKVKGIWKDAAEEGIRKVQHISTIRTFDIGGDISFCIADARTHRTENEFMPAADFATLIAWAQGLKAPGVLVLPQPLIVKPGDSSDKNLANYKQQYSDLLSALASSGHDILVLSGDVHFGRIASVSLGNDGATMHEVVSSPLSNLTGVDGKVAADTAKQLEKFPAIDIDGFPKASLKVKYPKEWRISTKRVKYWFRPLNHTKTKEHFFTLSFSKFSDGKIKVDVEAWRLRERGRDGLPRRQFKKTNILTLK